MENWKKRLERFHNGIIKSGECRAEQEGFLCCLEDEGVIDFISQELDRAREEVLLELLKKKTNYKIERVDHGYKVTQEYVLVSDIEKELSKLKSK